MPSETPVFRFEQDFENHLVPIVLGRLNVRGYTIRWYFTPQGVMLAIPFALRDHPAVHWYPGDSAAAAHGTFFPPPQEEEHDAA